MHLAGACQQPVRVEGMTRVLEHPVVEGAVARTCVEGKQVTVTADPGDVRHSTDIQHCQGLGQICRQSGMIDRHERSPLPSSRDVGRTKIVRNRNSETARQSVGIADLPGPSALRLMQDRLSVKPHQVRLSAQCFDRADMIVGKALHHAEQARIVRP